MRLSQRRGKEGGCERRLFTPLAVNRYLVKTGNGHVHAPEYVVCVVADQARDSRETERQPRDRETAER